MKQVLFLIVFSLIGCMLVGCTTNTKNASQASAVLQDDSAKLDKLLTVATAAAVIAKPDEAEKITAIKQIGDRLITAISNHDNEQTVVSSISEINTLLSTAGVEVPNDAIGSAVKDIISTYLATDTIPELNKETLIKLARIAIASQSGFAASDQATMEALLVLAELLLE